MRVLDLLDDSTPTVVHSEATGATGGGIEPGRLRAEAADLLDNPTNEAEVRP